MPVMCARPITAGAHAGLDERAKSRPVTAFAYSSGSPFSPQLGPQLTTPMISADLAGPARSGLPLSPKQADVSTVLPPGLGTGRPRVQIDQRRSSAVLSWSAHESGATTSTTAERNTPCPAP